RCYPQVFHACHTQHERRATNAFALSPRDGDVLAHLDARRGMRASDLAAHLGVGAPTLSASIARLERHGLVERARSAADRRALELRLTAKGAEALQATSVLDAARLRELLDRLAPGERAAAVHGMELLARAARELMDAHGSATRWGRNSAQPA